MFRPKNNYKNDPKKQWNQSDRIFFGFGACHILVGTFLETKTYKGFYGEWIVPHKGFRGHHMYATNGKVAFDFHGYSLRNDLLNRYWKNHQKLYSGWDAMIEEIKFSLLDTEDLNRRYHRGPDQYCGDPIKRAEKFILNKPVPLKYRQLME